MHVPLAFGIIAGVASFLLAKRKGQHTIECALWGFIVFGLAAGIGSQGRW